MQHPALESFELQAKVAAKTSCFSYRLYIGILQGTNPGLNDRSDNYSSNWQRRQINAKLYGIN
jgi:hypothetical protein